MTIDRKYAELMQEEIDGALPESGRSDLHRYMATSPEARELYAQLQSLSQTLARVPSLDPPIDLKRSIMSSIVASPVRPRVRLFDRIRAVVPDGRAVLRYGYAAAAGLLIGIAFHFWAPTGGAGGGGIDPSDLAGTMARMENLRAATPIRALEVGLPGLTGEVRVRGVEAGYSLEFDLDAGVPVGISLGYDPAEVAFRGFAQDPGASDSMAAGERSIAWTQSGKRRLVLLLTPLGSGESRVDLRFSLQGGNVQEETIILPPKGNRES